MSLLSTLYQWLFPSGPFEFITHHEPDECVSLLTAQVSRRYFPYWRRLKVDIQPDSDQGFGFVMRLIFSTMILCESQGTLKAVADDYALLQGVVRTKPYWFFFLPFLGGLPLIVVLASIFIQSNDPAAWIGASIALAVILLVTGFNCRWASLTYLDLALGTLLRIFP